MKLWRIGKKSADTLSTNSGANSAVSLSSPIDSGPPETQKNQETFKEHYPLLFPYSYAAIVEDEKKDVKYSVLEPTLTALDESWIKELKSILWDELFINTRDF